MHQKSRQLELALEDRGEAPTGQRSGEAGRAARGGRSSGSHDLMERVVTRENAKSALERVRRNKGSAGIDGLTVGELEPYLRERWDAMMEPIRRNDIHAWCAAFVESLQATRPAA